ncbi:hypothetical protein NQ317_014879 [Molorchus minor]|uniref:THAP-type domain-containing protein n=1 Tax=Molorchus minor TaxID=1323400 RepID=A0ABQ9IPM5_9CUCU|nr:hypothetical protein NQ317_014879 [Molorchus minor]
MSQTKYGLVCAAKGCSNKSYNSSRSFSDFQVMLRASNQCSQTILHSLNLNAVPTLFPSLEGSSREDHNYSRPPLMHQKIQIIENRVTVPGSDLGDTKLETDTQQEEFAMQSTEDTRIASPLLCSSTIMETITTPETPVSMETDLSSPLSSPSSTQTPSSLSFNSPRKSKYRNIIKNLTAENKRLQERIEQLEHNFNNPEEYISLEQYKALTFKFCKSVATAKFINIQVTQGQKHPKGRRYSKRFKHDCLSIYFAGPKVYKQYFLKNFILPTPHTLLREIRAVKIGPGLDNPEFYKMLKRENRLFSKSG